MSIGGAPKNTTQTVTQSDIPSYAKPYYLDMLNDAQALKNQEYSPYGGQRVAGFNSAQQQTQQDVLNLQTPQEFSNASSLASAAGLGTLAATNSYAPSNFGTSMVNGSNIRAQTNNAYGVATPQNFDSAAAQQYMSPYIQNVINNQQSAALRAAQQSQLAGDLGAARQGTYGGARQLLATTERENNLQSQMNGITANGLQSAYTNAQSQFNTDRSAGMDANNTNLQALLNTQNQNTTNNLEAQRLNAANRLQAQTTNAENTLNAQRYTDDARLNAAKLGLSGYGQAADIANTLSGIGTAGQNANLAVLQAQANVGNVQQGLEQQVLDTQYKDFLQQRDYPMELLQNYNSILHGSVFAPSSTQTTYAPSGNTASNVLGTGLQALSLYNMAKG